MLKKVVLVSMLLAFVVVVFGAFVRLSDAGLGCPDWPGCYGHISVPESEVALQNAQQNFPERKVEAGKAWVEMTHRYLAGTLGLLILSIAILSWRNKKNTTPVKLPIVLVGLVGLQALLGMWTVTLLLKPVIVTLHLLGGMTILSMLAWLSMGQIAPQTYSSFKPLRNLRNWAVIGILILLMQIALGGWVSSNYAALACGDEFPLCQSQWMPPVDFQHGFQFIRELGVTVAGAPLSIEALSAIHWMHRVGALITFLYLMLLGIAACRVLALRTYGGLLLLFLGLQVSIGIANVVMSLPLHLAVAHNAGAALLLVALVALNFKLRQGNDGLYQS